jgi:hypothetical protein
MMLRKWNLCTVGLIVREGIFKGLCGICSSVTSESVSYPTLQRLLVQDTGATAVTDLIYLSLVFTKCTCDKESGVTPTNRASFSDDVSSSLVFLQQLGPELQAIRHVIVHRHLFAIIFIFIL